MNPVQTWAKCDHANSETNGKYGWFCFCQKWSGKGTQCGCWCHDEAVAVDSSGRKWRNNS